jgi:hypothetical protein
LRSPKAESASMFALLATSWVRRERDEAARGNCAATAKMRDDNRRLAPIGASQDALSHTRGFMGVSAARGVITMSMHPIPRSRSASTIRNSADPVRLALALARAGAGVVTLLVATSAGAFCRTTTCNPKQEHCAIEGGCNMSGQPLFWQEKCLSFGTQKDGSHRRTSFEPNGISYEVADRVFQLAFAAWTSANCGGRSPSFKVWDLGPIECGQPEFNDLLPNANVWMFRDNDWPYKNQLDTLALTTVMFERSTGAILDADVEINSFSPLQALSTSDLPAEVGQDLQAIATHEAGHFLGLSHSKVATATMNANYRSGDLDYRSLDKDDIAGICEIYSPDREAPDCTGPHPPHGFSRYCGGGAAPEVSGCSFRVGERNGSDTLALFMGCIAVLALRKARDSASLRK